MNLATYLLAVFTLQFAFGATLIGVVLFHHHHHSAPSAAVFITLLSLSITIPFTVVMTTAMPLVALYLGTRFLRLGMVLAVSGLSLSNVLSNLLVSVLMRSVRNPDLQVVAIVGMACACALASLMPSIGLWKLTGRYTLRDLN